jgi:hypothetical protein
MVCVVYQRFGSDALQNPPAEAETPEIAALGSLFREANLVARYGGSTIQS